MKISLCMIVGKAQEYIERCLTDFAPLADEVCLVRAIGSQKPDATIEKAELLLKALGKPCRVADYLNQPGHRDWPHIDDFAAARQMSFDLASGEYCFWCDTDDVLDKTPVAGQSPYAIVREIAERGGWSAFMMPYRIFGRGVSVPRERMISRLAGKWIYPVHESFKFHLEPAHAVEENRVVVVHMPHLDKKGSSERNLRILKSIPDKDLTAGLLYHLQGELSTSGDIPGSIKVAERALKHPDLGRPEKYELFLNLAQMSTTPEAKEAMLIQAYATDPRRREALGILACTALDYGKNDRAMAYARQMMSVLPLTDTPWNDRAAAYGWLGDEIYTQALRANGFGEQAEIVRREMVKRAGGPRIALIHATRGRPQQAAMARKIWLDLAENPPAVEHIFMIDEDDADSVALKRMHHRMVPPGGGCVAAWNMGVFSVSAPVLVQMSDDWIPMPQWDRLILERIGDVTKPKVLAISDGVRADRLLCMAICTRAYVAEDCFLFHPAFMGVYSDNWFTDEAYRRGAVIEARDIRFVHEHPIKTGKPMDKTYAEQNSQARYAEGLEIYLRLQSGRDWSSIPGWFDYWWVYDQIAEQLRDGDTAVEVGVWLGRSITYLAQRLKAQGKRVKLIAVDTFKGEANQPAHTATIAAHGGSIRAAFEANIARCEVADMIEIIVGDSAASAFKVANGSVAFCFIDAAHDYDSVKADILAWEPKIKPEGTLAGHDALQPAVYNAVTLRHPKAKFIGPCWIVRRDVTKGTDATVNDLVQPAVVS